MGSLRGDRDVLKNNTFEGGCLFKVYTKGAGHILNGETTFCFFYFNVFMISISFQTLSEVEVRFDLLCGDGINASRIWGIFV